MRYFLQAAIWGEWLFLLSCAPSFHHDLLVEQALLSHRYADADRVVEKNKEAYGARNSLLYYFDRGLLLHFAGRYEESNVFFGKANAKIEELYTESVGVLAEAFLTNDNLLPYEGQDFETVLIHLFSALNYAAVGKWDDSLVEARQVDAKLNLLNDRYMHKNVYKEDAFARYLSGILYEGRGESNDAFISYRKAHEAYQDYQKLYQTPVPSRINFDLLRLSEILHLPEEKEEYQRAFPGGTSDLAAPQTRNRGEIIVVTYTGRSPVKENYFVDAPVPDGSGGVYLLRVAFPRFVPRRSYVDHVDVVLTRGKTILHQRSDLVEDIEAIAEKNLEDHVDRISAKAIARATSKFFAARAAKREAKKRGGEGAELLSGLLENIYSVATEESDNRSWRTLPGKIYLARLSLPEGEWEPKIGYYSKDGRLIEERRFSPVTVENGKTRFVIDETQR